MDLLLVAPDFRATFHQSGLTSSATVSRLVEQPPGRFKAVIVRPVTLSFADGSNEAAYFKRYNYQSPSWRFFRRASKARREFDNYTVFRQAGIRCPEAIATGESRDRLGRLKSAWILTRAVPDALPLGEFLTKHCPDRTSPEHRRLRRIVLDELARMTRRLHATGFVHNDLVWRNVLVTVSPPGNPLVWWIDCPRGHFARVRRRRQQLKDLALLDKVAAERCSRSERWRFLQVYLGKDHLDPEVRQWGEDVAAYSKRRW